MRKRRENGGEDDGVHTCSMGRGKTALADALVAMMDEGGDAVG